MAQQKTLATIETNPLSILQDPRVVSTAMGVWGGNAIRKAFFQNQRETFGWAEKDPKTGQIRYYGVNPDGSINRSKEVPNAYQNRVLLHLGQVLLGTIAMSFGPEKKGDVLSVPEGADSDTAKIVKYAGLGLAASGFANLLMTVLNLE